MKLYYLHGFRSNIGSTKLDALKKYYTKVCDDPIETKNIQYEPHKPQRTIKLLHEIFNDHEGECVVIGCSLGGFWANYVSKTYIIQCILINPSVEPSKTLPLGETFVYETNERIEVTHADIETFSMIETSPTMILRYSPVTCLLSLNDEVLDYRVADKYFDDAKVIKIPGGGHRVIPEIWKECVEKYLGKELFWLAG